MPPPQVNTLNCIILQSKTSLRDIPQGVLYYFVNSKRRFFVYFKHYQQMIETMRTLNSKNIRFYRRQSILPDREEQQQHVYHCNYRFKRQDLRKNLYHSTPYNEPKVLFDKYERAKSQYEQHSKHQQAKNIESTAIQSKVVDQKQSKSKIQTQQQRAIKLKNQEVWSILTNKDLLKRIFISMNVIE